MVGTAFATDTVIDEEKVSKTITADELLEQLNSIDFGIEATFTELPQSRMNNQELLGFNSVEDMEAYLRRFIAGQRDITPPDETFGQNHTQPILSTKSANFDSGWWTTTVWWWGGGNNSLFGVTNAETEFYYSNSNGGQISNITVTDSYMTGIVGASWTHRHGSGTPLGGMDAEFSVTGTWLIGLDIYGYPVGFSFNETLNSPVITIDLSK